MPRPVKLAAPALAVTGLLAGGVAYAASYPDSQIFGRTLIAGRDPRQLALTFDDGPNPAATPQLLDLLEAGGVRATFFLVGNFVRRYSALARRVAAAGHLVGNHTMSHPRLFWQTAARIRQELGDTSQLLEDTLGLSVRYLRPPFGSRRPAVFSVAADLGLTPVMWNVTAADWKPIAPTAITRNVLRGIARNARRSRGSNILLHDGSHRGPGADRTSTLETTRAVLDRYGSSPFVTVDGFHAADAAGG